MPDLVLVFSCPMGPARFCTYNGASAARSCSEGSGHWLAPGGRSAQTLFAAYALSLRPARDCGGLIYAAQRMLKRIGARDIVQVELNELGESSAATPGPRWRGRCSRRQRGGSGIDLRVDLGAATHLLGHAREKRNP
jgi:hypothetical protein